MPSEEDRKIIYEAQGTEIQTSAGGGRRYRKALKRFRWRDIGSLLSESFDNWYRHNDTRLGASLAFYTLLSLAPLVLVLTGIAGMVFGNRAAAHAIVQQVQATMGPAGAEVVRSFLHGHHEASHGLIASIVGLITLLFTASGVLIELHDTLNAVWEIPGPQVSGLGYFIHYIKRRLLSFAMILAIGFLLIVSLAVTAFISSLDTLSVLKFPGAAALLQFGNSIFSFVVIACIFAAIYKIVPDVHLTWRDVILGGGVTSLLFTLGKLVLGIYLGRASYTSMYGAAASIVVAFAWVYYSGQIFFLGAEFTHTFAQRYGTQPKELPRNTVKLATDTAPETPPKIVKPPEGG